MTDALEALQTEYRAMLRRGILPTGLLLTREALEMICSCARARDPRIEWGDNGVARLFGFRPRIIGAGRSRFVTRGHGGRRNHEAAPYTLAELRAL